jgi:hypothetical protein
MSSNRSCMVQLYLSESSSACFIHGKPPTACVYCDTIRWDSFPCICKGELTRAVSSVLRLPMFVRSAKLVQQSASPERSKVENATLVHQRFEFKVVFRMPCEPAVQSLASLSLTNKMDMSSLDRVSTPTGTPSRRT